MTEKRSLFEGAESLKQRSKLVRGRLKDSDGKAAGARFLSFPIVVALSSPGNAGTVFSFAIGCEDETLYETEVRFSRWRRRRRDLLVAALDSMLDLSQLRTRKFWRMKILNLCFDGQYGLSQRFVAT